MAAESDQQLQYASFWDAKYSQSDGSQPVHEWFRNFEQLEPFLTKYVFSVPGFKPNDNPLILHAGSGDSTIPHDFYAKGYRKQLCVDFSQTVVNLMSKRHKPYEGIEWRLMDLRDMQGVEDSSVDVIFDKGALDAMVYGPMFSPPKEVKDNVQAYLKEAHRVLKPNGKFLWVGFRQPLQMQYIWNLDELWKIEKRENMGEPGGLSYYGWVFSKVTTKSDGKSESPVSQA